MRTQTLAILAALVFAVSAAADTITVCLDGSCDYTGILEAIDAASDGDVIEISAGAYFPTDTVDTVGKSIVLRGSIDRFGYPATEIDIQGGRGVLRCKNSEQSNTRFENLIITGGDHPTGGGLRLFDSRPTFDNCVFVGNHGSLRGGGVYCENSNPHFVDCLFMSNTTLRDGAGMACHGSNPILENCVFISNSASGEGGGLYCTSNSEPVVLSCNFIGNTGSQGGGVYALNSSLYLADCLFEGNNAEYGAGLSCRSSITGSDHYLTNVEFRENTSSFDGGGIEVEIDHVILRSSLLCGNSPSQILGEFTDDGGNCIVDFCEDDDRDGIPDDCGQEKPRILLVPSEYETIASAIDSAWHGDIISIAAGTYTPEETLNPQGKGIALIGSVDSTGYPATIIDANFGHRVIECTSGEYVDTVFENLLITRGSGSRGGGLKCSGSQPTLTNCVFLDNFTSNWGGGLFCEFSSPTLVRCQFIENEAVTGGGGLLCDLNSNPVINECVFKRNTARYEGGGLMCKHESDPILTDCLFDENVGDCGGGICCRDQSSPRFVNCIVQNNIVIDTPLQGGGMSCVDGSPVLENCVFHNNSAVGGIGGGLACFQNGTPMLSGCSFMENSADNGGGVYLAGLAGFALVDCQFILNAAEDSGGGLFCATSSDPLLTNCAFIQNRAYGIGVGFGYGGAIYCSHVDPILQSCSFTDNVAENSGGGLFCAASSEPSFESCVFQENTASGSTNSLGGGAICLNDGCKADLDMCTFIQNAAFRNGGAIDCRVDVEIDLRNCQFDQNQSSMSGGGLYMAFGASSSMIDCEFMANACSGYGGGLFSDNNTEIALEGCLVQFNTASYGGGIAADSSPLLGDTIVCGNAPDQVIGSYTDVGDICIQETCIDCGLNDCSADISGNGLVDGEDLGLLFAQWGACGADCTADLTGNGQVDGEDLGLLFAAWGACP